MGSYIQAGDSNSTWLLQNGTELDEPPQWPPPAGQLYVCLVENFAFDAALICYCASELDVTKRPEDPRPKTWFTVSLSLLLTVSDVGHYLSRA